MDEVMVKRLRNGFERYTRKVYLSPVIRHEVNLTNYILGCKNYGILWQRDFNASKNMLNIASSILKTKGIQKLLQKKTL